MKNAQEHNEYTEKENDQLRTDALMMINALRAQHGDAVTRVISHLAASDQFSALVGDNIAPYRRLMTYYECAMMEVETKFRVLDAEYGLQHDRNPIESIKRVLRALTASRRSLRVKGCRSASIRSKRTSRMWRVFAWCAPSLRTSTPWQTRSLHKMM